MNIPCNHCQALHFPCKRTTSPKYDNYKFSSCFANASVAIIPRQELSSDIRRFLTEDSAKDRHPRQNLRSYNTVMSMGSVTASCVWQDPQSFTFNPTYTLHGRTYHYVGALSPPSSLYPAFLSAHIPETNFLSQTEQRELSMPQLCSQLVMELTAMLHDVSPYVQTSALLQEWATTEEAPDNFCMIVHENHRSRAEHV